MFTTSRSRSVIASRWPSSQDRISRSAPFDVMANSFASRRAAVRSGHVPSQIPLQIPRRRRRGKPAARLFAAAAVDVVVIAAPAGYEDQGHEPDADHEAEQDPQDHPRGAVSAHRDTVHARTEEHTPEL